VNGIRACHKKACFAWFFDQEPDVLCLQEIKADPDQIPDEMKSPAGYFAFFDNSKIKKGYSGVAIYTKQKPQEVMYGLGIKKFDDEGRCIGLKYPDFWLFNVYIPNGRQDLSRVDFKMEYCKTFLKLIEGLRKKGNSIVVCGDINVAHAEIDLARAKENQENTGFLPVERAWLDRLVKLGYVDTFRSFYPDKRDIYTYWDQRFFARDRNVGWRIDYFFVTPDLKKKLKSADILEHVMGSDHCPVSIEIHT